MANEREKTVWETIIGIAVGALGAEGINKIFSYIGKRFQEAAMRKADEMASDHGARTEILSDIATLMDSKDSETAKAGAKVLGWFIKAQENHLEGELTNLYRKFPANKTYLRRIVFRAFGKKLPDNEEGYKQFVAASYAILKHDNILQMMLKAAENAQKTGGSILNQDMAKIKEGVGLSIGKFTTCLNTLAGGLLPIINRINEGLRRHDGKH